jgi:predicted transcriptional regulator
MLSELKRTIKRPDVLETIEKDKVPVSILMNTNRQKILLFLFKYPCSHLHKIGRSLDFSLNTTRWHLRKLEEKGYIEYMKFKNRKIFFPTNSLKEVDMRLLSILNDKKFETIYQQVQLKPGITQKEIYSSIERKQSTVAENLNILEETNLIRSQRDGLYRRYYPTPLIKQREKKIKKTLKSYRRTLLQFLKSDGLEPELLRTTDIKLHIRIRSGLEKSDLIFIFNPYERFVR